MIWDDQVFVVDVVVINLTWETVVSNVISWLASVAMKFNAIVKIRKYKKFHHEHHFISMAMEMHGAPECDMDHFIRECVHFFHNKWSGGHLFLSFCIYFFRQHVSTPR
jgi:hypothetical protein